MAMGSYLSIINLNVNELNSPTKRQRLAEWNTKTRLLYILSTRDPFSYCSWGSQGKNTEVVYHSLLQWTTFCWTKVRLVKAMVFPVVMYGRERWTVKKAAHRRIDAFELWCWRRLLRVPWTARRSNQSILKEIDPGCSTEALMLKLINTSTVYWRIYMEFRKMVMITLYASSKRDTNV